MSNLSDHLTTDEFKCHCCGKLPPMFRVDGEILTCYQDLFSVFENIRLAWGKPLIVTSGYRCPAHNKAVGGEPLSAHVFGLALDLKVGRFDEARELAECAKGTGLGMRLGYKKYTTPTFHVDVAFHVYPRPSEFFIPEVEW